MQTRIIQKEDAVFWLDSEGRWNNEHGPFEHPKLIRFFHASIQKDDNGYFVYQKTDEYEEKVYFKHDDTALFVFDIRVDETVNMLLNTGDKMVLDPTELIQKNDALYVKTPEHRIKFSQKALVKLSKYLTEKGTALFLSINNQEWEIASSQK